MQTLNTVLLIAAGCLILFAVYKNFAFCRAASGEERKTLYGSFAGVNDRAYMILLIAAVIAGVIVRVWQFGSVPAGFNQDGAMAAVDAKALADYGTDRFGMHMPVHLTAWGYGQMSALLSYLEVPFIKLFGLNPISARLPQLIMSLIGGVFFFLFVRDAFGKRAGVIAALFVAVNPWHILQSRWALDCNLFPHFFIIGLYFLSKGLNKKVFLYVSMIFFALCMYCYGISIYTIPVFLLGAGFYYLIRKKLRLRDLLISAAVYLFFAWPFIACMIINFFKLPSIETPLFTIPFFENSVRSNDILFFAEEPMKQLAENFKSLMNTTILQKHDLPWNDVKFFSTMYIFSIPFMIIGIYALIREKSDGKMLAVIFLLTGIWSGLVTKTVNVNRINIIYYALMILAVLGIKYTVSWIRHAKWGVLACYAAAFVIFTSTYFGAYAEEIGRNFYDDFSQALEYVEEADVDKFYITPDSQYKNSKAVSEILTLFWHEIDAEYFQGKTTEAGELPYARKYVYQIPASVNKNEKAAYVVPSGSASMFSGDFFEIKDFGSFSAVIHK